MTLSRRLIVTVAASVGVAIVGVSLAMGFLARDALIEQAEDQARLVAGLIASEANRAELTADEIDRMTVDQMEAQALAIARHLENHDHEEEGVHEALGAYFARLTADSAVDDIWMLDERGEPLVRAVAGLSEDHPSDLASAGIDFRIVEGLVSGRRFSISFQSDPPMGWERPIRYVGVRAATRESVLVGSLVAESGGPGEIIGIEAALDSLAGREAIQAIWVVNDLLDLIGMAAFEGQGDPMAGASLSAEDQDLATRSLGVDGAMSYLGDQALHVAAPILDRGGVATGAAVIHMQREHLDRLFADHVKYGLIVAAAAFAIGSIIAAISARRIVQPVTALTTAAAEVDADTLGFEPATLDPVAQRRDELGTLIRVFQNMVRQVQAREEYLESMVRARTRDLEQSNAQLERAKERMESELKIAHALQGAILPKTMPDNPTYSGHALMTPAREMGGDFYDFFTLEDGRLSVVMADVSGKGVPAAFFMAIARTVMRAAAARHPNAGPLPAGGQRRDLRAEPPGSVRDAFLRHSGPRVGQLHVCECRAQPAVRRQVPRRRLAAADDRRHGRRRHARIALQRGRRDAGAGRHDVPLHRWHHRGHERRRRGVYRGAPGGSSRGWPRRACRRRAHERDQCGG